MTTEQYIRAKNDLILRVTGHILVPENQIVNEPKVYLFENATSGSISDVICPYCINRGASEDVPDCSTCPMHLAKNDCNCEINSTWYICNLLWNEKATKKDKEELRKLVQKYNKDIK
jgi:hypothetical protein